MTPFLFLERPVSVSGGCSWGLPLCVQRGWGSGLSDWYWEALANQVLRKEEREG